MQDELLQTKHLVIPDSHVILTSGILTHRVGNSSLAYCYFSADERDPEFWNAVTAQGWKHVNHTAEGTLEKYGEWYITLIDVVMQGLSTGFVGTHLSTVSVVSGKRVEDWYGGAVRMVRFGRLGADDH